MRQRSRVFRRGGKEREYGIAVARYRAACSFELTGWKATLARRHKGSVRFGPFCAARSRLCNNKHPSTVPILRQRVSHYARAYGYLPFRTDNDYSPPDHLPRAPAPRALERKHHLRATSDRITAPPVVPRARAEGSCRTLSDVIPLRVIVQTILRLQQTRPRYWHCVGERHLRVSKVNHNGNQ